MTEAEKAGEEQETANVKLYARVFRKCLEEAGAVADGLDWSKDRIYELARILFDRFWTDQAAVAAAARQAAPAEGAPVGDGR